MRAGMWKRLVRSSLVAALLLFMFVGAPRAAAALQQPATPPAQEGFVPIDQLPPDEHLPAAPLLIGAYVVAWLAVFGYLWSIWRRLARVERELADVGRRLEAGGRR